MNKILPSIYKGSSIKSKNKEVYYSFKHEKIDSEVENDYSIEKFFEDNKSFFDLPVEIKTQQAVFYTKIVGKVNNRLLTSTYGSIPFKDIFYIKRKK